MRFNSWSTIPQVDGEIVGRMLAAHPKVSRLHHLAHLEPGSQRAHVYAEQCAAPGSTFSFDIIGGEAEAFQVLNALQLFKLAVSLGGTCHQAPPHQHETAEYGDGPEGT